MPAAARVRRSMGLQREQNSRWGPYNGNQAFSGLRPNEWPLRGRRSQESRKSEAQNAPAQPDLQVVPFWLLTPDF
jgi:hypothetical protein